MSRSGLGGGSEERPASAWLRRGKGAWSVEPEAGRLALENKASDIEDEGRDVGSGFAGLGTARPTNRAEVGRRVATPSRAAGKFSSSPAYRMFQSGVAGPSQPSRLFDARSGRGRPRAAGFRLRRSEDTAPYHRLMIDSM